MNEDIKRLEKKLDCIIQNLILVNPILLKRDEDIRIDAKADICSHIPYKSASEQIRLNQLEIIINKELHEAMKTLEFKLNGALKGWY